VTAPILVTGATGTLGRAVVPRLADPGRGVRALSRRPRPVGPGDHEWITGDLRSGAGLEEAVSGVTAIVHCATDARAPGRDVACTRNLLDAARRAGSPHLVYISIVGVDRVPLRYYRVKLEVEALVERSGLPWTILRATQFHDLVGSVLRQLARPPVMLVPAGTSVQPVGAGDVAARLAELAQGAPAGRVPDLGGPEVLTCTDLARADLRARGRRRLVVGVRLPGKAARGYRQGGHLARDHADGRQTYGDFLARRP